MSELRPMYPPPEDSAEEGDDPSKSETYRVFIPYIDIIDGTWYVENTGITCDAASILLPVSMLALLCSVKTGVLYRRDGTIQCRTLRLSGGITEPGGLAVWKVRRGTDTPKLSLPVRCQVVTEGTTAALQRAVENLMQDGWKLQGGVAYVPDSVAFFGQRFMQAMYRDAQLS